MFSIMCFVVGLLTFSHNKLCDPIKDGVIQSKDQVCVTTQHKCVKSILAIYFVHFKLESMLRGFGVDQNREKLKKRDIVNLKSRHKSGGKMQDCLSLSFNTYLIPLIIFM